MALDLVALRKPYEGARLSNLQFLSSFCRGRQLRAKKGKTLFAGEP